MRQIERVVAAALAGVVVSSAAAQDAVQWRVEDGGNGHWYQAETSNLCFDTALTESLSLGANLASITSQAENLFVAGLIPNGASALLGLYQDQAAPDYIEPNGGWRWTDQTTVKYTAWTGAEPNNALRGEDFLTTNPDGDWGDTVICGYPTTELAIFEWSADCNGDGIVDYGQILDGTFADEDGNGVPDCCDAGTPCVDGAVQWLVEDGGNGHWYAVVRLPQETNWYDAAVAANLIGSHLATATDQDEAVILRDLAGDPAGWVGRAGPWAGGFQNRSSRDYTEPAGGWEWVTGEPWFPVWERGSGEPNNAGGNEDFLHLIADGDSQCNPDLSTRKWNDLGLTDGSAPCDQTPSSMLVEWSADCNGDGIVDYGQILDGSFADDDGNGVPDLCDAIDVPGDYATIQEAIDAAPDGGIIRIGPGTFVENLVIDSHSVRLEGAGRDQTTIDGSATLPVIRVTNVESVYIAGIRITNGRRIGDQIMGGGVSAEGLESLTIEDCLIDQNVSDYHGGGLCSLDVVMTTILRTDFIDNIAGPIGGCCGSSGGAASFRGQGGGGPCLGASSALLEDCRFIDNRAFVEGSGIGGGGALSFDTISDAALVIRQCHFEGNTAEAFGSCLRLSGPCATSTGSVEIFSSIFLGAPDASEVIGGSDVGDVSIEASFICLDSGMPITVPYDDLGGNLITEECSDDDCDDDGVPDVIQIFDGTYEDLDENGVPDLCEICVGDLNDDGLVGPPDLGILLAVWGTDGSIVIGSDINGDGTINASDLGPLLGAWGPCP